MSSGKRTPQAHCGGDFSAEVSGPEYTRTDQGYLKGCRWQVQAVILILKRHLRYQEPLAYADAPLGKNDYYKVPHQSILLHSENVSIIRVGPK